MGIKCNIFYIFFATLLKSITFADDLSNNMQYAFFMRIYYK